LDPVGVPNTEQQLNLGLPVLKVTFVSLFFAASAAAPNTPIASAAIASMARNLAALINFCRPSLP
jgi:hypothetical protein